MRAVVQRVSEAEVEVDGEVIGRTRPGSPGFLALVGAESGDGIQDAEYVARKIQGLRVFEDADGKMNLSLEDVGGSVLVVSQFTLLGDCRKGRRPSFVRALTPAEADALVQRVVDQLRDAGVPVETGRFGATMSVRLSNEGPVTLLLDSRKTF